MMSILWTLLRIVSSPCFSYNNEEDEIEVTTLAGYAQTYLKHQEDSSGVFIDLFVENFLDEMKIQNLAERQKKREMWPAIEKIILEDKRFTKTGKQEGKYGKMDHKYVYIGSKPEFLMRTGDSLTSAPSHFQGYPAYKSDFGLVARTGFSKSSS